MSKASYLSQLLILSSVFLTSCSSVSTSKNLRDYQLRNVFSHKNVYYQVMPLATDPQLNILFNGGQDAKKLVSQFHEKKYAKTFVTKLKDSIVELRGMEALSYPDAVSSIQLEVNRTIPVFFVYLYPKATYQRLPPRLDYFKLQIGVIAKVIPLKQVMSGKGSLAIKSAAWEAKCLFSAYHSSYIQVDEWIKNDAKVLKKALLDSETFCIPKIRNSFKREIKGLDSQ